MTLQNVKLPSIIISSLYKNYLVDLESGEKSVIEEKEKINFLGGNGKSILLLVNHTDVSFLPDNQLTFLLGILSACKLNMADIAVVNLSKTDNTEHKNLPEFFKAEVIILLGIEATALSLPFKIPDFQVQLFKDKKYLFTPALDVLEKDGQLKKKLWTALKNIFSI